VQAIFSDDSDDEMEASNFNAKEDPEKKIEVAHSTLNRLMAGDFLESLGKELGLEVPPNPPYSTNIARSSHQKESAIANAGNDNIPSVEEKSFSIPIAHGVSQEDRVANDEKTAKKGESRKDEQPRPSEDKSDKVYSGKIAQEDKKKAKLPRSVHRKRSSTSSEDERSRKRSRRHRDSTSDSYSDSSNDHRDRYRSKSKGRKKRSSREKKSSKKYSKQHKHGSRDSQ
jgi:G patch domain-containing protein 1